MVKITNADNFDELTLVVTTGDDYSIVCQALEFFRDTKVEKMDNEEILLDAIMDRPALRVIAGEMLGALYAQQRLLPLFIKARQEADADWKNWRT